MSIMYIDLETVLSCKLFYYELSLGSQDFLYDLCNLYEKPFKFCITHRTVLGSERVNIRSHNMFLIDIPTLCLVE
jgi:hypothetical protein